MKGIFLVIIIIFILPNIQGHLLHSYFGDPWKMQTIPGKIECEFYDKGGEGVAYHDSDTINNGSGKLNPANGTFLNEFRMHEGVDISYTKPKGVDENPFNKTDPIMGQLYAGWTQPGEWINYTVKVEKDGRYKVALMYTANGDGAISFDIDKIPAGSEIKIPTTHNDADTIAWRQWHHWNKIDSLTTLDLKKGTQVLTLHITKNGNINFDYLEFIK